MKLKFTKMHGAGNDFVVIDAINQKIDVDGMSADGWQRLADRRFGIGADQILVLHHGEIRERGTHGELLRHGGLYARLHELQFVRAELGEADEDGGGDAEAGADSPDTRTAGAREEDAIPEPGAVPEARRESESATAD